MRRQNSGPGRPKLPAGLARRKTLTIKLREYELEALKERAKQARVPLSKLVRDLLFPDLCAEGVLRRGKRRADGATR